MGNETTIKSKYFLDIWETAYTVLSICSPSLSTIGSTTILYKIIRDRLKDGSTTPYDRFMVGVSCGDIIASIYFAMSQFLWKNPSPASCKADGILVMLAGGSVWYNGLLSFYFLLTVLSQVRRKNLLERFEPWMHLSVISILIIAILSYLGGWVHMDDSGRCEVDPIAAIVGSIIIGLSFLSMIVNYSVIYAVVRKTLRSPNKSSENVDGSIPVRNQLFRESTNIMALYVGCYLVAYLPFIVVIILPIFGVDLGPFLHIVFFQILHPMFSPLQGVFNAIIYLKPFYTRFRAAYPNKSKWFVLRQSVLNSKAPRKNHRRIANHHTYHSDFLITDITLGEDGVVNPNELLFYPGRLSNNIIAEEGEDNGAILDNVEESK